MEFTSPSCVIARTPVLSAGTAELTGSADFF
jgi:hypothetical protein